MHDRPASLVCGQLPNVPRRAVLKYAVLVMLSVSALAATLETPRVSAASLAGMAVFLDPGHNGANDPSITRQVSSGRGGTKECITTGTEPNDGHPEHAFNWDVVWHIRDALKPNGRSYTVVAG